MHAETYVRQGDEQRPWHFSVADNFIHGNEGMPKDAAFWQFLYLIFAKMYDERANRGQGPQIFRLRDRAFH